MANWIDLTVIAVLFLFGLRGYFRGLSREVLSLTGLIVAFLFASRYSGAVADWGAADWKISPFFIKGLAFVALFFVVYFVFNLAGWLLHRSEKLLFLKTVNRIGGIAIGLGKGTALTGLLILFFTSASWLPESMRRNIDRAVLVGPLSYLGGGIMRIGKERIFTSEANAGTESSPRYLS